MIGAGRGIERRHRWGIAARDFGSIQVGDEPVVVTDVQEERIKRDWPCNLERYSHIGGRVDLTHGGADFTLDTSSQPEGRVSAVRSAKVWGTVAFVGERNNVTIDVSPDMLRKQLTIIGSWTFSAMGMQECAEFIAKKRIPLERIFSDRWRLEQAAEAYKKFDTQTTGKGVFLF